MNDTYIPLPANYNNILMASKEINFSMPSDLQTGALLRTLVASKPKGNFLELGTGTGLSLAWIVEGMDANSMVISIDNNEQFQSIAKEYFDSNSNIKIICEDGSEWIKANQHKQFDLIFADAWPGKYDTLDETLALLKTGGFYIIDDMLPQPNWPAEHDKKAENLASYLESKADLSLVKMKWSTGIIIVTKIA